MRVVLATSNRGKLLELQSLFASLPAQVLPLSAFSAQTVDETGLTFVENAIIKARFAAGVSGLPAIADDSGIEVDALHGEPGIRSARYAGERAGDLDNLHKLLREMDDVPESGRTARFRCALVYMRWDLDPSPIICQAGWEGRILRAPRGSGGFGYDPVFQPVDSDLTAAELATEDKNRLSHRGQALREMAVRLAAASRVP